MRAGPDLDAAKARLATQLMIETNIDRARVALAGVASDLPLEQRVAALRAKAPFSIPEAIEAIQFIDHEDATHA